MQDIVILSGKGGTGKTTIAGALASLWQKLVLVDCDVDASNLHIITQPEIKEEHSFKAASKAVIDPGICTGCDVCVGYCRFNAVRRKPELVSEDDAGYRVDELACEGCGLCRHVCPEHAIELRMVETGKWYLSETPYGQLLHGKLAAAQGNSGRMVSLLRGRAREVAGIRGFKLTLIDGPPGISCPTIASLTGAHYVLIVTEPSISAFHDMCRVVELARHFRTPIGICINKYDINEDVSRHIEVYAGKRGVIVLGRLPYDRSANRAQVCRTTVIEHAGNRLTNEIQSMHERLTEELNRVKTMGKIETGQETKLY